jgi:hypothetical protein
LTAWPAAIPSLLRNCWNQRQPVPLLPTDSADEAKKELFLLRRRRSRQRNAIIYTLIANCRLHQVEPHEYLKDVLTRLPPLGHQATTINWLTSPQNWKAARQKNGAPAP